MPAFLQTVPERERGKARQERKRAVSAAGINRSLPPAWEHSCYGHGVLKSIYWRQCTMVDARKFQGVITFRFPGGL
jgi:hypothetical protein